MKKRIYLIMADENLFHPHYVLGLIEKLPSSYQIIGLTIAKDTYKKGFLHFLSQQWHLWGILGFFYIASSSYFRKILDKTGLIKNLSLNDISKNYKINVTESYNVNEPDHLKHLKSLKIDIIISSCGHIFKKELLNLPKIACINRHTALLPKYGGVLPVFWAMYFEEKEFGVSVHYMVEKIDKGDILSQIKIPLPKKNSLFKNYYLAFEKSIHTTISALTNIEKNKIVSRYTPNDKQYFSFPKFEQISELRKKGYSTFNFSDLLNKF